MGLGVKNTIVKDVQMHKGQKNKKTKVGKQNTFAFIEFDHINSVAQAAKVYKNLLV